ncbi:MAG TPA: hypothetical protein VFG21_05020 [Xanthomonadaceae bacterium]|nr:hypothetical protein [Xanthomonadaceae bacterium]
MSASAFANALPLWLIAGSAEFRYLLWTVLAAGLAWLFGLTAPLATLESIPDHA